MDEYLIIKHKI